ncbi:MAG: MFS transporter [Armatimonadota bacterium]
MSASEVTTSEYSVSPHAIERAVKLSYAQAMFGSIFAASTGGMFLIGYALKLQANDAQIGLMSTIPMCCVVVQLLSATLIERGASRRMMTILGALLNVIGWAFIILIPYVAGQASTNAKIGALIGIITLVTIFANISGNARGSWIGDLIPSSFRGTFFGRLTMFAGIIGALFAVIEGRFLDAVKSMGIGSFSWLFGFGMLIGLVNTFLFVPQADVPVPRRAEGARFFTLARETFANKPLMMVMLYALLWSLQVICGPFVTTYMLRDLGMSFLGIGLVNACVTLAMIASSPFWGRLVDRYGCRPVLIACSLLIAPTCLIWLAIDRAVMAYYLLPPVNLVCGFAVAGISVALSTLVYKVTPSAGRSVQFAIYSVLVTLAAAPMPFIGGHLVDWLHMLGIQADLRATFYFCLPCVLAAAFAARYITEPDSRRTRDLVRNLPGHLRRPNTLHVSK